MKSNKKFSIFVTLAIAVNFAGFGINNQSAISQVNSTKKQTEFYLPKSLFKTPENSSTKKVPEIKDKKKTVTPVIKDKIKPVQKAKPQVKTKMPISIKPEKNPVSNSNKALSLSHYIKNINSSYSNTFMIVLSALSDSKAEILSFNSMDGKIYARLSNHKNLYVLIHPVNSKITSVRITPADGIYNISDTFADSIFEKLDRTNFSGTNKKI